MYIGSAALARLLIEWFGRRMLRNVLLWMLGIVVALYAAACVALFVYQRSFIYFPQPNAIRTGIDSLTLSTPSGSVTVLTRERPGDQALLYFGGNGEDVSLDIPELGPRYSGSIYLLNYPGYGSSPGHPSERAILDAAFALFDRVHAAHPNVLVIGRSLGSGVAVRIAADRPVSRLVLVTPFSSLADVGATAYPYFPVRLLLRDKFDSRRYAPKITASTRILAAEQDEIVPRASAERLRNAFHPGVATYTVLPGVGHNSISVHTDYYALVLNP